MHTYTADSQCRFFVADIHCRPPLQTSIAHPGCTHYLADLLCRLALPSDDPFSALAFWGGPGRNPFLCPGLLGGSGPQCFPLPWPFGGVWATILSSALALSGGGGLCTRDACTCAHSLMHGLGVIDVATRTCRAHGCIIKDGLRQLLNLGRARLSTLLAQPRCSQSEGLCLTQGWGPPVTPHGPGFGLHPHGRRREASLEEVAGGRQELR